MDNKERIQADEEWTKQIHELRKKISYNRAQEEDVIKKLAADEDITEQEREVLKGMLIDYIKDLAPVSREDLLKLYGHGHLNKHTDGRNQWI